MTKIKSEIAYPRDTVITDNDFVIGSDGDKINKQTKNYFFKNIREFVNAGLSPEVGGTLKISEITNNTGDYTSPATLLNELNPTYAVLQYHVVIVTLNGNKYLLSKQNITVGDGEDAILDSDFILLNSSVNLGSGFKIYTETLDVNGAKEYNTISKLGSLITITEVSGEIVFSIDESALSTFIENNQKTYSIENLGDGIPLYVSPDLVEGEFRLKTIKESSQGGTGESLIRDIQENTNDITIRHKKIKSSNSSVSIISTDEEVDFKSSTLENGTTTIVNGDGITTPYSTEVVNLQKTISSFPYTIVDGDDKNTIFINNATSNVVINVPDSLVDNFACVLIQKGTGTVDFVATGTATLNKPSGLEYQIKGNFHWALIEKELTTDTYYLGGSLKTTP